MNPVQDINTESPGKDETLYTVFEGSSQEDIACAKVFWNSVCLQPPIESSLVAADITQRLKIAKDPGMSTYTGPQPVPCSMDDEILQRVHQLQIKDEKERYMKMAKRREEIMALLKKQRESRIEKEISCRPYKPRRSEPNKRLSCSLQFEDLQQDIKDVRELV